MAHVNYNQPKFDKNPGDVELTPSLIYRINDLVRDGNNVTNIARILEVKLDQLKYWYQTNDCVRFSLENIANPEYLKTLKNLIIGRLPGHLELVYKQIEEWKSYEEDQIAYIDHVANVLSDISVLDKQRLWLHCYFIYYSKSRACRFTCIEPATVENWIDNSEDFRNMFQSVEEIRKDFVQEKYYELAEEKVPMIVKDAQSKLNADRGFGNTVNINHGRTRDFRLEELLALATPEEKRTILGLIQRQQKSIESKEVIEDAEFTVKPNVLQIEE